MPEIGKKAPDFELPATKGDSFRLSEALGKGHVLLAFYPFDWSPVCTNELGYLNTNRDTFARHGVSIAAISVDSPFSHQAWADTEALAFPLLSDFNKTVCAEYDVVCEEFSGLRGFAKRSVFLIASDGTVRYRWVTDDPGVEPDYQKLEEAAAAL